MVHGQAYLGQITMMLDNYGFSLSNIKWGKSIQQFQRYAFRKAGPSLWQIGQFFGPLASPYGANGQMTMTVHNYRPRQFHRISNGENPSNVYRDMGSASLATARPPPPPPRADYNNGHLLKQPCSSSCFFFLLQPKSYHKIYNLLSKQIMSIFCFSTIVIQLN